MKEMFDAILDKDEHIIKVYKPNKKRFIKLSLIFTSIPFLLMFIMFLVFGILALSDIMPIINEDGSDGSRVFGVMMIVFAVLSVLFLVLYAVIQNIRYKKTFYAFSNKRILIRSGFIGVDFIVLEMKLIGAIAINVGLVDKFVHPNTGSIRFGSNSTPMGVGQNRSSEPTFAHIDNAYETYREIKEVFDQHIR